MFHLLSTSNGSLATGIRDAFLKQITQLEATPDFLQLLYDQAVNESNKNIQLQFYTWAADLGNVDAINYLHSNKEIIQLLAEELEKTTYDFFKERVNMENNSYSLYMLGMITNVCNNPDHLDDLSEKKLTIEYYTKAVDKDNPLAMISLAYFYHDFAKDKVDDTKSLVRRANEMNFPIDDVLKCYL